jgi:hemolysin activation/secretion protein
VQRVADGVDLFLHLSGQAAGKNLDSSEKMSLGGPTAVRSSP